MKPMPTDAGVIAVVPDAWDETCTTRHSVLQRLAAHFPVAWVEPADCWQEHLLPGGRRFLSADSWQSPLPNLDVLTPGSRHPSFYRPAWLARAAFKSRLGAARAKLLERGARRILLYLWRDEFAEALDLVAHDASCYHVDDEYSFSATDIPNSPRETRLLHRVDQVIVHSAALLRKKGGVNPRTAMIPNGVDFQAFAAPVPPPADIAAIEGPRIGYAGVIKKQLDLALLARLALARPHYSFVLVGPVKTITGKEQSLALLQSLPNVHFLGEKPAAALGSYIQRFDVCLMCYEVNDYTRYINPLKLNEYLATGRPAISSPIDAVLPHAGLVTIAATDEQWLDAIESALRPTAAHDQRAAAGREFARQHDWNTLVESVAHLLAGALERSTARPG